MGWDLAEAVAENTDKEAEVVDHAHSKLAEEPLPAPSARVLACTDLILGVEAQEDVGARGDVTAEFSQVTAQVGAKQAFRAGRVAVPAGLATAVPVCAKVVVVNDGGVPWPAATSLAVVAGDAMGFPQMALGALQPGEAAEVQMDLLLPPKAAQDASRSAWALVDAATGQPLGPLIFFEGVWM